MSVILANAIVLLLPLGAITVSLATLNRMTCSKMIVQFNLNFCCDSLHTVLHFVIVLNVVLPSVIRLNVIVPRLGIIILSIWHNDTQMNDTPQNDN
jgi:hypothetical protein